MNIRAAGNMSRRLFSLLTQFTMVGCPPFNEFHLIGSGTESCDMFDYPEQKGLI